jgi:cell division protein FtsB
MASKLEDRVAELERQISDLKDEVRKGKRVAKQPEKDAWKSTFGAFADDRIYQDVVRLGRAWHKRQPKC